MSECMPCSKGDTSGGATGKLTPAVYLVGMGCTRKLHAECFAVCGRHQAWLIAHYTELVCAKCADLDRTVFFIDGFLSEVIHV